MLSFGAQSFAPFAFSPIAFAIQELIEETRWDTSQGVAGGKKSRAASPETPAKSNLLDDSDPWVARKAIERQNAVILQLVVATVTQGLL